MQGSELDKAQELIKAKRYSEAEILLKQINHPTAKQWLIQLQEKMLLQDMHTSRELSADYQVTVTTGDLHRPYKIISPIYYQITNKGVFSSQLGRLKKQYKDEIEDMRSKGQLNKKTSFDLGILWYGEWSVGQNDFETAFFIAVRELQKRAFMLKADAVIAMRQDIDLDTTGFQFFYLQMYGTAVRYAE